MICLFVLGWFNTVTVHNASTLNTLVGSRPSDQPLITFSNHDCCLDDPLLYGTYVHSDPL